ncbi:MAG: hypothetical protein NZ696_02940, partial [Thermomicrobium sp.]|nr:hypothetical protein [Thermomicrobium sp.]
MEELVPLVVHGISWSRRHGHPIVLLRGRGTDAWFAVATDPEMAQAFSTCPCTRDRSLRRLASLVHQLLGAARAVVEAVMLDVDDQGILSAEIVLASPSGAARITAAGLDGLLLATACGIDPVMRRQRLETVT